MLRGTRGAALLALTLIVASAFTSAGTRVWLREHIKDNATERPPLYLPDAKYVKLVTLGFDNFSSDLLWFNTVNYFGKQLTGKRDYRWLGEMCELVLKLDPRKEQVVEFCSNMLSWEAKEFNKSIEVLSQAIKVQPTYWRWRYLRGFNYFYFLEDKARAREDLAFASTLPECPAFVGVMASRLMIDQDNVQSAIDFLRDLIRNTSDKNERSALEDKLRRALISRDLRDLKKAAELYQSKFGKRPESLQAILKSGIIARIPAEPFGGKYLYDPTSGEVKNSTRQKGLEFFGRNKNNGLFSTENRS